MFIVFLFRIAFAKSSFNIEKGVWCWGGWGAEILSVFGGFEKLVSNCKSIDSWPPKRLIFTWLCSRRSLTPVIPAAQSEIKFPFVYISLNICDLLDSLQQKVSVFFLLSVWTSRPHLCCQWILLESRWQIVCCRWRKRRLPAHFYRAKSQAWLQTELDKMKFCYQLITTTRKFVMFLSLLKIKTKKSKSSLACVMGRTIQSLHRHDAYCPIALSNW